MLGLQDRTIMEVGQAGAGRRLLRLATSSMFAEHAAPGLIDLFTGRADDLDVELSVHPTREFGQLLLTRTVDAAIGPRPTVVDEPMRCVPFLNYQVVAVAHPEHAMTRIHPGVAELREQTWLLGPSAIGGADLVPSVLRRLSVPEEHQQIFQSHAAALEEAKRGRGIALIVSFAAAQELASGELKTISGAALQIKGAWCILTLADRSAPAAAEELARFVTTPRATQAMLRGSGVSVGRFRPSIHVTLWS
jgi:DNA-binding transcriptional LysR family regulator